MPELPDVTVYIEALDARIRGARLAGVRLASPFVLRSVDPPLADAFGRDVIGISRLGKRIVIALGGDLFLVLHLMIAGRLHWKNAGARPPGKIGLAAFDFSTGTLTMTEAGTKRRASIHLLRGEDALRELRSRRARGLRRRPPIVPRRARAREPHAQARSHRPGHPERHRQCLLRRDPPPRAPVAREAHHPPLGRGDRAALRRLPRNTRRLDRSPPLRGGRGFPRRRHRLPCRHGRARALRQAVPGLQLPVQRIVRADNETNYCARCQTGGRLLADRALSRLLKKTGRAPSKSWRTAAARPDGRNACARGWRLCMLGRCATSRR